MIHFHMVRIFLTFAFLATIISHAGGQTGQQDSGSFYNEVSQLYGSNQIPLVGMLSEYQPNQSNHPFLFSTDYQNGSITIHNITYNDVQLRYNIYEQQLIVLYLDPHKTKYGIIPPVNFISEFSIGTSEFKKFCFDGECSFYEVIHADTLSCLYSWHKKRSESHENRAYITYDYHSLKRRSYLVINKELFAYSGNSGFVKLFPKEHKKSITSYMKNNKVDVRRSDKTTISELVAHCQQYLP